MKLLLPILVLALAPASGFNLGGKPAVAKKSAKSSPKPAITFGNPFGMGKAAKKPAIPKKPMAVRKKATLKAALDATTKAISTPNPLQEYYGLIGTALVLIVAAKATIFAPPPEPTGPPLLVVVFGVLALAYGALMLIPEPVTIESWYDTGYRLDGSHNIAADKAEAILKEGLRVEEKTVA